MKDEDDYSGDYPRAYVTKDKNGKLILVDPDAAAMAKVVSKQNCRRTAIIQKDRLAHFAKRIHEKSRTVRDTVIVLINVDSLYGAAVAELLMPGTNWDQYRDRGEIPYARGLAERDGMQEIVEKLDPEEGKKMRERALTVVVMDHNVVTTLNFLDL